MNGMYHTNGYKWAAQYIGNPLLSLIFCHAKLSLQSKLLSMSLKPCTVAGMNENLFDLSGNQLHMSGATEPRL